MPVTFADLIDRYDAAVKWVNTKATREANRAYGGVVRASKGNLVETITKDLVGIAWAEAGGQSHRLSLDRATVQIPLNASYLDRIQRREVAEYIRQHIDQYTYGLKTDVHVSVDGSLVMGSSARLTLRIRC